MCRRRDGLSGFVGRRMNSHNRGSSSVGAVQGLSMKRRACLLLGFFLAASLGACGGGGSNSSGGGGGTPQNPPTLASIAPSGATAGAQALTLALYGSNFENGATAQWNGTALSTSWVNSSELTAALPASDIASAGTAKVSVSNPSPD